MTKKDIKELLIKYGTVKKSKFMDTRIYNLYYDNKKIWDCLYTSIIEKENQEKIRKEVIRLYMKQLTKYCYSPFWENPKAVEILRSCFKGSDIGKSKNNEFNNQNYN